MLAPTDLPTVPVALRVHLAHATVQAIAEEAGADVLHIKGPSVDPDLRPEGRTSADADVLVRPSHLARFQAGLKRHDWQLVKALRSGGLVQHSTNWYHGALGQMDVHVRFPGIQISPEVAFEALWRNRGVRDIAHRPCTIPDSTAQRLVVLLHAARSRQVHRDDIRVAWTEASATVQAKVSTLAHELDADVAHSVVTGHLDDFRDRPEYALWRLYADGATTTSGFTRLVAEIRATPAGFERVPLRIAGYAFSVLVHLPDRLETQLARKPTRAEVVHSYVAFVKRAADLVRPSRRSRRG